MNGLEQVNQFLSVTGSKFVQRVHELQQHLQSFPEGDKVDPPVNHYFGHKTYVREMLAPSGSIIVGKTHRYNHTCIVLQGKALVYSESGSFEIQAPFTFSCEAGAKRLFGVLEDLVFQTVHYTESTDLAVIEQEIIVPDAEINQFRKDLNLEV